MRNRLQKFLESQGISAAKFADEIGVQRSAVSHILSERNKPGFDFIQKILDRYKQINAEWLIMGTGNMLKEFRQTNLFDQAPISKPIEDKEFISKVENPSENFKENELKDEPAPVYKTAPSILATTNNRNVDKIIFIYSDKSFSVFHPNEN